MEKEIKKIICNIYNELELLDINFKQIEYYIKENIKLINKSPSFDIANKNFDIILEIQSLWKVVFNSNYNVNKYIYTVFSDFDRIDLLSERKRLYEIIKNTNKYL